MDKHTELHSGHRERLRQRLISEGLDNFEPHELLEFLLYYAIPRQNVNMLAHALLNHFGNLPAVFSADIDQLSQVKGMGGHAARWIYLLGRCLDVCGSAEPADFMEFINVRQVIQGIREISPRPAAPCVMQLCLNRDSFLLYRRIICSSRSWGSPDVLRSAISDVLSTSAKHVILVIFLSEPPCTPSAYDLQKIQDYIHALNIADCTLLDVLLIFSDEYYSLRRHGDLPRQPRNERIRKVCESYLSDVSDAAEGGIHMQTIPEEENYERIEPV